MEQKLIPLLEFDENKIAKAMPHHFNVVSGLPEKCVIAFFHEIVDEIAKKYNARLAGEIKSCTCRLPVYIINYEGCDIALVCGFIGAANAAAQIEELICGGARQFIVCGSAGSLTPQPLGALVIPNAAVRDEGASFHYAPPSYEIEADREIIEKIAAALTSCGVPYIFGKTWTTDAFYRETEEKVALRRSQGCVTVEMEASAMMAAAQFRDARLGQILYCGDDLSGDDYDHRDFFDAKDTRRMLVELSIRACAAL